MRYILHAFYLLEVVHDGLDVLAVVDAQLYGAVKHAVIGLNGQAADVDIHL